MRASLAIVAVVMAGLVLAPVNSATAETFETNFNVSYGQLSDELNKVLNESLGAYVRTQNCAQVGPQEYACGEIPIGVIKDKEKKHLFEFRVKGRSGTEQGFQYSFGGEDIKIYLNRAQTAGTIAIASLNTKAAATHPTSAILGDNLYLRLTPANGALALSACLNIPGTKVFAKKATFNGSVHKSNPWYMPDVNATLQIDVKPGELKFASGKICSNLKVVIDATGLPVLTLESMSPLTLTGVDLDGLRVSASVNVGGVLGKIIKVIDKLGLDIERMIAEMVQKEVLRLAKQAITVQLGDVKSGRWFNQYFDKAQASRFVTNVSNKLRANLKAKGFGKVQVANALTAACLVQANRPGIPAAIRAKLFQACARAPKIKLSLFQRNPAHAALGCYSYYFDPRHSRTATSSMWWREGCEIVNRASLTVPNDLGNVYSCLAESFRAGLPIDLRCQGELSRFVMEVTDGRYDALVASLPPLPTPPTLEEIEHLRTMVKDRTGIVLPPARTLLELWR